MNSLWHLITEVQDQTKTHTFLLNSNSSVEMFMYYHNHTSSSISYIFQKMWVIGFLHVSVEG